MKSFTILIFNLIYQEVSIPSLYTLDEDFLKAMCVAQKKYPAKKYLRMKMCRKEHNTQKK